MVRKTERKSRRALVIVGIVCLLLGIVLAAPLKSVLGSLADTLDGSSEAKSDGRWYTCGMHPWVVLPEPGNCPICHMTLTPIDPDKLTGEVTIDPVIVQNIGVRIATVERGPVTRTIRTVGTVTYDETQVRDINLKTAGWIEKLHVDYLGAPVKKGDALFELYAPELFGAQQEYLEAYRRASAPGASRDSKELLESARTRLAYFDISDDQIAELEVKGEISKTLTIKSPFDGLVVEKNVQEGMKAQPGAPLFRIADLRRVWVMVSLYEHQLPFISPGSSATMSLAYLPGQVFGGKLAYVYPTLDVRTREAKARLEFDNPTLLLKPGMFTNIELKSTLAQDRVLVPREAVIDTGERQVAFVSRGGGRFEPRDVRLGAESEGGRVQVLSGLEAGEQVVVSGQFLLHSEARIREGLAKMVRGDMASEQAPVVDGRAPSQLARLPDEVAAPLVTLLEAYFEIGDALAGDALVGVADSAARLSNALAAMTAQAIPEAPHFWHQHGETDAIARAAKAISQTADIADARRSFADLSIALDTLLRATGVPPAIAHEVQALHCPMYREDQGGNIWLQPAGDVRNPFMGSKMLACFDEREALPVTGAGAGAAKDRR